MSLHLHRAERADRLVDALAELLSEPLADPFTTEVVCVPTRGVERWLAQRLSHRLGVSNGGQDGICSGVWFPSLRRLIAAAISSGGESVRTADAPLGGQDPDPWQPDHAVWPLLRVIDECRSESWAALLWSYLAGRSLRAVPTTMRAPDRMATIRRGRAVADGAPAGSWPRCSRATPPAGPP